MRVPAEVEGIQKWLVGSAQVALYGMPVKVHFLSKDWGILSLPSLRSRP